MTAVTFQSLMILLLSGLAVGACIDSVRLLKDNIGSFYAKYWSVLELLIWIGCGSITFYLLYNWQDGHWRGVNFLAQLAGIFLYDCYLFRIIRLGFRIIVYSIITPISLLSLVFCRFALQLYYFAKKFLVLIRWWRTR